MQLRAKVLTVSDSAARGVRVDTSGPAVVAYLEEHRFSVVESRLVGDGLESVRDALSAMTDGFAGLVASTGGTGFGPRDLTPEATSALAERDAPGLAELMRRSDPKAALSRGRCGCRGCALIVNLPGSPTGALECLGAVIDLLPHALALLGGESLH